MNRLAQKVARRFLISSRLKKEEYFDFDWNRGEGFIAVRFDVDYKGGETFEDHIDLLERWRKEMSSRVDEIMKHIKSSSVRRDVEMDKRPIIVSARERDILSLRGVISLQFEGDIERQLMEIMSLVLK